MDSKRARFAVSLVDLTDLSDDCDITAIDELCGRAATYGTAAVCVWPDFVAQAARALAGSPVAVATVVNFPSGTERAHAVGIITRQAVADGADEIDVVLPYTDFAAGRTARSADVLDGVRSATDGSALMKVILETGELSDVDAVERASRFAIEHGADFIKTSTGKTPVSATPEAAETMLRVIAGTARPVGLKPSGGIRSAADAERYLTLSDEIMGAGWLSPATFRFGASGLLSALLVAVEPAGDADGTT